MHGNKMRMKASTISARPLHLPQITSKIRRMDYTWTAMRSYTKGRGEEMRAAREKGQLARVPRFPTEHAWSCYRALAPCAEEIVWTRVSASAQSCCTPHGLHRLLCNKWCSTVSCILRPEARALRGRLVLRTFHVDRTLVNSFADIYSGHFIVFC